MPRKNPGDRRCDRAKELLDRVRKGPSLCYGTFGIPKDPKEIDNDIRLWLSTWIEPAVLALVPELRKENTRAARNR